MAQSNLEVAEAYYRAFAAKDVEGITRRLHADARVLSPLGEAVGREAVVAAASRLMPAVERIDIRARFERGDQVMLVYDLAGAQIGVTRTAALLTFKDGLLWRSELFLDPAPFAPPRA